MIDTKPRAVALDHAGSYYLVVESDSTRLDDDVPIIVQRSGLTAEQMIVSIMARVCYKYGMVDGRFRGRVVNDVMPLCEADGWEEAAEPGVRTWRRDGGLISFDPYTFGDVQTVLRCGISAAFLSNPLATAVRMNQGGEGLWVENPPDGLRTYIETLLQGFDIPIEEDSALLEYIEPDGRLTY